MTSIQSMLPRTIDNEYCGHRAALWVLGVLLVLKALMSINSIFNGFDVARNADGIPLDSYPAAASQTIVALFAIFGLGHLLFTVMGAVALARFRSLVPFFFALFLAEHLIRRVILRLIPIERTGNPPATIVNMALIAVMMIGLALSLWKKIDPNQKDVAEAGKRVAGTASGS